MTLPPASPDLSGLLRRPRIEVSRERDAPDYEAGTWNGRCEAPDWPVCHIRKKPRLLSTLSRQSGINGLRIFFIFSIIASRSLTRDRKIAG